MGESLLKKEFKSKDVNRARNLVNKDFSAKTVDGIGYSKAQVAYKEGDIWEENGRNWTIKDGLRQGSMNYYLSHKMYKIHKMCFDCVIDYEAELRKAGLYESYEKNMMQGGLKAFARDIEQWVLDSLESTNTFVTEQGDVEDWNSNDSKFKEQMTTNLQEYLKHLKSHMD
jgi:hypothetical protein